MRTRWIMLLAGALLASPASAAPDGSTDVVRDLAIRVGPIVGGTLACRDIVRSRLQVIVDKFHTVIRDTAGNEADDKNALAKYFAGEPPDYTSLEGYVSANVLIEALKRVGPQFDTERVVESLEATNNFDDNFDLGIGSTLSFGRGEHQASHKIWGKIWGNGGPRRGWDLPADRS